MENINKEFRKKEFKGINFSQSGMDAKLVKKSEEWYLKCINAKSDEEVAYKNLILSIIYLDAYKMNIYAKKVSNASKNVERSLAFLRNIKSLEDLLKNKNEFKYAVGAANLFDKTYGFEKNFIFACIPNEDNKKMLEMAPNHELDVLEYKKEISPEDVVLECNKGFFIGNQEVLNRLFVHIEASYKFNYSIIDKMFGEMLKCEYMMNHYAYYVEKHSQFKDLLAPITEELFEVYKEIYLKDEKWLTKMINSFVTIKTSLRVPNKTAVLAYISKHNFEDAFLFDEKEKRKK